MLSETDAAYIAGIFDGEGCITAVKKGKYRNTYISVTNTDFGLLEWLRIITGIGTVLCHSPETSNNKKAGRWYVTSNECLLLFPRLLPYMRVKRKQAELAMKFHYSIKEEREALYVELANLSKRGPQE